MNKALFDSLPELLAQAGQKMVIIRNHYESSIIYQAVEFFVDSHGALTIEVRPIELHDPLSQHTSC
jgi:hypothetical protein